MNLRARRARTTTTVCSKHASVPEIYENKETVFNLRRQLSLSPATGPGRKARQLNSSVKRFFQGIPSLSPCWYVLDFWKIKLEKSSSTNCIFSLHISNWIFTACVACKNQFRNWFLQVKNPVHRTGFFRNQLQINRGCDQNYEITRFLL